VEEARNFRGMSASYAEEPSVSSRPRLDENRVGKSMILKDTKGFKKLINPPKKDNEDKELALANLEQKFQVPEL
jgi:hypothetical protein